MVKLRKVKDLKMDEDFSNSGLIDIVSGLRDIDADPNGSPVSEDRQGDENIRLTGDEGNGSENW